MSLVDDLASQAAESVRRERPKHPQGWEPGTVWTGRTGSITTAPLEGKPDWSAMLREIDLDPALVEVIEPVEWRTWDAAIGNGEVRKMRYWKARIQSRTPDGPNVEDILRIVKRARHPGPERDGPSVREFHLSNNDWQIGKKGTDATVERIRDGFADAETRLRSLMKERPVTSIGIDCVGDLFEGCKDHYAMQTYEVELDNRDQGIIVRRLVQEEIDRFRRIRPVNVRAVGGNHGEERADGKAYTTFSDNKDVAAVEAVAEACAKNPRVYGNVAFMLPRDELTLTFDAAGTIVTLAHGHQIPGARGPKAKTITEWWKAQMFGMRAAGDADLLLTAHLHQFLIHQDGKRTLMIAPTTDGGSQWYAEKYGVDSVPAILTFTTSGGGWDDVRLV